VQALKVPVKVLWPGVIVASVVAIAAMFVADHHGAPVMLFALFLGMALNFLSQDGRCVAGIEFTSQDECAQRRF